MILVLGRQIFSLIGHRRKSLAASTDVWTILNHWALLDIILVIIVASLEDIVRWNLLISLEVLVCISRLISSDRVSLSIVTLGLVTAPNIYFSSYLTWCLWLLWSSKSHRVSLVNTIITVLAAVALAHGARSGCSQIWLENLPIIPIIRSCWSRLRLPRWSIIIP